MEGGGHLEQRDYALIPDLIKYRKSGFRRVWKKNIGESRRKLADKALEKNRKAVAYNQEAIKALKNVKSELHQNTRDYKELRDHIRNKENFLVVDRPNTLLRVNESSAFTVGNPDEVYKVYNDFINNTIKTKSKKTIARTRSDPEYKPLFQFIKYGKGKKGIISVTGTNQNTATLAHEYGHNINRIKNNIPSKLRNKFRDNPIIGPTIVLNEEIAASKNGLKEMSSVLGRRPTALEKQALNIAADSYRTSRDARFWGRVADKVNIPSRRSTTSNSFSGFTVKEQLATPGFISPGRAQIPRPLLPTVEYTPTRYIK